MIERWLILIIWLLLLLLLPNIDFLIMELSLVLITFSALVVGRPLIVPTVSITIPVFICGRFEIFLTIEIRIQRVVV